MGASFDLSLPHCLTLVTHHSNCQSWVEGGGFGDHEMTSVYLGEGGGASTPGGADGASESGGGGDAPFVSRMRLLQRLRDAVQGATEEAEAEMSRADGVRDGARNEAAAAAEGHTRGGSMQAGANTEESLAQVEAWHSRKVRQPQGW